jgi:hypothetical protein
MNNNNKEFREETPKMKAYKDRLATQKLKTAARREGNKIIIKEVRESNKIYDRKYWVIEYDDDGTPYAEHNTRTKEHRYLYKNCCGEYRFDYRC